MSAKGGKDPTNTGLKALRRFLADVERPARRTPSAARSQRGRDRESLNTIIESEIIPRLLAAHPPGPSERAKGSIDPRSAGRFAELPARLETAGLIAEIEPFLADGASARAIYLDLLAPAARRLGEMWEADECDFVDVTIGLGRLREVMREIAARDPAAPPKEPVGRILFAAMPGDQHDFAPAMLDQIFAAAGWDSSTIVRPLRHQLLQRVANQSLDVVALTVTRDCPSAALTSLIAAIREASANAQIAIIIGGHMINQKPAIVAEVGADGTGADARAALDVAERLVQSCAVRVQTAR